MFRSAGLSVTQTRIFSIRRLGRVMHAGSCYSLAKVTPLDLSAGPEIAPYVTCLLLPWVLWCRFQYMAVSDTRQRIMPFPDDRAPPRGHPLAYPEAVLLVDPINPALKGEVCSFFTYTSAPSDEHFY